jgi:hypothetical protein
VFPLREIFKTQLLWPAVAIVATAAHHLVLKHTPAGANPFPRASFFGQRVTRSAAADL